jgi:hypothetical protein
MVFERSESDLVSRGAGIVTASAAISTRDFGGTSLVTCAAVPDSAPAGLPFPEAFRTASTMTALRIASLHLNGRVDRSS